MKIISWNCNMAFRKKADFILQHDPDILIIQECESPGKLKLGEQTIQPASVIWAGTNENKGMGIFSYSHYRFRLLKNYHPELKYIIPLSVTGGEFTFILLAVWANNPTDPEGRYVEQIWKALSHYKKELKKYPVIIAGDFNSNAIWDRPRRQGNHSAVVQTLEKTGIRSTYHLHHKQIQGREAHPTLYMYRHKEKPYHLDYCFASQHFLSLLKTVETGDYETWIRLSDHVPLMVTFQ